MPYKNRWKLSATLRTVTPLHVGDGGVDPRVLKEKEAPVNVNSVATDGRGQPYIPGSTIKGNLFQSLKQAGASEPRLDQIFGCMDEKDNLRRFGGKIEFHDCFRKEDGPVAGTAGLRWWLEKRKTCVAPGVSIDRHTRTAIEKKLFHDEYVPPGTSFSLAITGQGLEPEELALIVAELAAFEDGGVTLGAGTKDGWGRTELASLQVARLDLAGVTRWLDSGSKDAPDGYYSPLKDAEVSQLRQQGQALLGRRASTIRIKIRLQLDGNFLVNDPSRRATDKDPNHAPIVDSNGCAILPSSSIRGAVRSQAERILRTIAPSGIQMPGHDPAAGVKAVLNINDAKALPPIDMLFGAPGWRAPIGFTDFVPSVSSVDQAGRSFHQEFVAIDRFTGGGAEHKKFNAASRYRPVLEGTVSVDIAALGRCGAGSWAYGLLALALRDLIEGDVPLGFGASKGYGACRGTILSVLLPDGFREEWKLPAEWKIQEPIPPGFPEQCRTWVQECATMGAGGK